MSENSLDRSTANDLLSGTTLGGVTIVYSYNYDLAGCLIQVARSGVVSDIYTYDTQDRLLSYGGASYT